ncbi:hypothetical protein [Serratia fonticola]|uniref:hypothetical protein n=1 Tax=Serratia fonticola TaxID=47917 RepID=UPI00093ACEF1|nr:hypothetical protein [Serratia fonticola]OKP23813.1 hypothetical protein BSQ40_24255 [Serratia fonticola]
MNNYQKACKGDRGNDRVVTFTVTATALRVACVTGLLALLLGSMPAMAKRSESTGTIEGRAPTAGGQLLIKKPDGALLVNNDLMTGTWTPNGFGVSPDGSELLLTDPDGDCDARLNIAPCTATINTAGATKVWQVNGVNLTTAQLAATFLPNLAGQVLTLTATAPVTTASPTGAPKSNVQTLSTVTYRVNIPDNPMVRVNGYSFAINAGFPTTGFVGANFQFWMNGLNTGANSNYTYSSNRSWVTVDSTGMVSFVNMPSSTTKNATITITPKGGVYPVRAYNFNVDTWFMGSGNTTVDFYNAQKYCTDRGYQFAHNKVASPYGSALERNATAPYLWPQWGNLNQYYSTVLSNTVDPRPVARAMIAWRTTQNVNSFYADFVIGTGGYALNSNFATAAGRVTPVVCSYTF